MNSFILLFEIIRLRLSWERTENCLCIPLLLSFSFYKTSYITVNRWKVLALTSFVLYRIPHYPNFYSHQVWQKWPHETTLIQINSNCFPNYLQFLTFFHTFSKTMLKLNILKILHILVFLDTLSPLLIISINWLMN